MLNVLNYDMSDIFAHMGINTAGGVFCFPEKKETDSTTKLNIITTLKKNFNLPVSDEYLYEEFGVEKPDNYEQIKKNRMSRTNTIMLLLKYRIRLKRRKKKKKKKKKRLRNQPRHKRNPSVTGLQVFRESPVRRRGSFRLVVDELYGAKENSVTSDFEFSEDVLRRALLNIYSKDFHPVTDIEINLFNEVWSQMNKATKRGSKSPR